MTSKKTSPAQDVYQIKVTLLDTDPPIWRRLLVPADLTLARLHKVLQAAMGWNDDHLHEFRVGQRRESERAMLSAVLQHARARIGYTYDFGDSWELSIVHEKLLPADPNATYPICTDGQLAGPPEDCGGIPGFYDLLDAIADPGHPNHNDMRDWLGGDFDPQAFSIDQVNRRLSPRRGRTSTR